MDEARKCYDSILELFPGNIRAKQGLAKLSQLKPDTLAGENPSDEILHQLIALYNKGQIRSVIQECEQLTKEFPQSFLLWNLLGAAFKAQSKLEEAIAAYNNALLIKPGFAEAHNNIGAAFQSQGKFEEASAAYNKALLINPDYAKAHYNLGVTLKELGRLEEAEASYRQAITVKPDYAKAHYNLGITLQELGRSKDAEASYRKAIALKPDYAKAHYNLGLVLQTLGNIDAAAAVFRDACNLDPASHMSLFYLHSTYYRDMNTDFDAAIKCLNEAVQIAPTDGLINFFLGMLLDYKGQEEKAEHYFSLVHENMSVNYAQFESWSWVKSTTSQYPLLFWQKYDGFDYAFDAAQLDGLILEFGVAQGASIRKLASMTDQVIHGFDSFQGLPESWSHLPKELST